MQNARLNVEDAQRVEDTIRQALLSANAELLSAKRDGDLGGRIECSALVVLAARQRAYVGHVGDARLYLVRKQSATRMTRDHTTAQSWIDHGIMSEEEAKDRPEAHSLSRALGDRERLEPEVRPLPIMLEKGDVLVLASSGVHWHLSDDEVAGMAARLDPEHASQELCAVAGGRANRTQCTAVVYQSRPPTRGAPRIVASKRIEEERRGWSKTVAAGAGVLALIAIVAFFLMRNGGKDGDEESQGAGRAESAAVTAESWDKEDSPAAQARIDTTVGHLAEVVEQQEGAGRGESTDIGLEDAVAQVDDMTPQELSGDAQVEADLDGGTREVEAEGTTDAVTQGEHKGSEESARVAEVAPDKGPGTAQPRKLRILRGPIRLRHCKADNMEGEDAKLAEQIGGHIRDGNGFLEAVNKNAGRAGNHYRKARRLVRKGSPALRRNCRRPVADLRKRLKQRYLHIAAAATNRAIREPENMEANCAKARRMAEDARYYGATDDECGQVLTVCTQM